MIEDAELLRRYAVSRSEEAFAEIVQRHLGLVYSVALRQVEGDAHLAQDVTQQVFTALARKAAPLSRHPVLSGWLYRSTQFAAIDVMRSERRRRAREQEAQTMHELSNNPGPEVDGEKLRPVLDQVMGELNDRDRDAVMLRFFEGRPFAEVGTKLRLTEDAARMRVERALDKMRWLLVQRGVTSTTAALAVTLANQAAVSAPAGLAAAVTGAALSGTTAAGGGIALMTFMSTTKLQIGIIGALLAAGAGGIALQQQTNAELTREVETLGRPSPEAVRLQEENHRLAQIVAELESYRGDGTELARLRAEAAALAARPRAPAGERTHTGAGGPTGGSTAIYPLAQLDQVPVVAIQGAPAYPVEMRRAGITGNVTVRMTVDENGNVTDVQATNSSRLEFDDPALEAVKRWKFQPGLKGGQAVRTQMEVQLRFSLDNEEGAAGP
jgi:RNA polymerase sigma factor (sigma-70 family)